MRRFVVCLLLSINCSLVGPKECELPDPLCDGQGLLGLWLATQPYTRFVVSANSGSNSFSIFGVARSSGVLTKAGDYALPAAPTSLAFRASTGHLFVATSANIFTYELSAAGGSTLVSNISTGGGDQLALHPNGRFLFLTRGANNVISSYSVAANGVLSFSSSMASTLPSGMVVDSTGQFLYAVRSGTGQIDQYFVDQNGGLAGRGSLALACTGSSLGSTAADIIAFACSGANAVRSFRIDSTGLLTAAGLATATTPRQPAVLPSGLVVLGANQFGISIYSQASSSMTTVSTTGSSAYRGLALDSTGQFAWAAVGSGGVDTYAVSGTTLTWSSGTSSIAGIVLLPINY